MTDPTVLRSDEAATLAELQAATRRLDQVAAVLGKAFRVLRDSQAGSPGAQSYDGVGRGSGKPWCWTHQRDHAACRDDTDLLACEVETIVHTDPAGEAALIADRAAAIHHQLRQRVHRLHRDAVALVDEVAAAAPQRRPATDMEKRRTAMDNTKGCECCAKADDPNSGQPIWSPVSRPKCNPGGNLPRPIAACEDCYRRIHRTGSEPSKADVLHHHMTGKWPRQHETTHR